MALNQSGWTRNKWHKSASLSKMFWVLVCLSCTVWVSRAAVCPCERPELCQHIRTDRDFEVVLPSVIITHSSFSHLNMHRRTPSYITLNAIFFNRAFPCDRMRLYDKVPMTASGFVNFCILKGIMLLFIISCRWFKQYFS